MYRRLVAALAIIPVHAIGTLQFPRICPLFLLRRDHGPPLGPSHSAPETSVSNLTVFDEAVSLIREHYLRRDSFLALSRNTSVRYDNLVEILFLKCSLLMLMCNSTEHGSPDGVIGGPLLAVLARGYYEIVPATP